MSLKVGIAGIGHMGSLHLLSCLKMPRILEVKAVADKSARNRKFAAQYNIRAYEDYRELIDDEGLDCIIVSLPNYLKKECFEHAVEKGIDVFVDKPIARNYDEAKEMAHLVERTGIRLMVGSNYRYHPSVLKIKDLWEEGRIGNVHLATYDLIMNGPFSHPLTPRPVADWYLDPNKAGGGVLLDLGYHLLDLNVWLFGKCNVLSSHLQYVLNLPVEDAATIVLESKSSGVVSIFNVGWFSRLIFPEFNFRVNLHGTSGYLSTDQYAPRNMFLHAMKEAVKNTVRKCIGRQIDYLSYTYYYSSFFQVLLDFFNSIRTGTPFAITLDEELEVMRIVDEIYPKHLVKKVVI